MVKFSGGESPDTAYRISHDSAAALLKTTHATVFFLDHKRSPKKALTKLKGDTLLSIEVAYGNPLVLQYGNEAKQGVVTVLTNGAMKAQIAQRAKDAAERKKQMEERRKAGERAQKAKSGG